MTCVYIRSCLVQINFGLTHVTRDLGFIFILKWKFGFGSGFANSDRPKFALDLGRPEFWFGSGSGMTNLDRVKFGLTRT